MNASLPPDNSELPGSIQDTAGAPPKRPPGSFILRGLSVGVVVLGIVVLFTPTGVVRETARRSVAASNLRQIGQASLIYASDHADKLPEATDIWEYAGELAKGGGLNDATIWMAGDDPANAGEMRDVGTVLTSDKRSVLPAFRKIVPSWAVPLGGIRAGMPEATPIAWTRGLRADGTWSAHSPHGKAGGHVVFLGGNVAFYRNLHGQGNSLVRFDGKGLTANVLEALPPGTRIGEYLPTEAEQRRWARAWRVHRIKTVIRPWIFPVFWLAGLAVVIVQMKRRRWPVWSLIWFLLLSFLAAIVMPTVG